MSAPLLNIRELTVAIHGKRILDAVSLQVPEGKIVGIVGGSGSGKTTVGLSVLRVLPPVMRISSGRIEFCGRDLSGCDAGAMRGIRGKDIGMIFQEPLTAFDPLFTIGAQLDETLRAHVPLSAAARRSRIAEALHSAGIPDVDRIAHSYPHQLSGGLRQRAMIAQAVICRPRLVIADEPTSSLDVTVQAGIMQLLRRLNREQGMSIVLISHDLGLIGAMADSAVVMHEGKVVEQGPVHSLLRAPDHPYTKALVAAH